MDLVVATNEKVKELVRFLDFYAADLSPKSYLLVGLNQHPFSFEEKAMEQLKHLLKEQDL
jgi:hypothetical protein